MPREIVHVGRRIQVAVDTSFGPKGELITRDMIFHPGAVVILPMIDAERVCLLRNFRFVIGETLWELPAGTRELNEPLLACAQRELAEESGYTAAKWTYLGFLYASPGVMNEQLHLLVAEELSEGVARPEVDEQLEPVTVRFDEAITMCLTGEILDAKTITSLLLWDRLRHQTPITRGANSVPGMSPEFLPSPPQPPQPRTP